MKEEHAISIECLPGDLIEAIEIEISEMQIGDALHLSEVKISSKLKLLGDEEAIVLSITAPRVEEEEEEEVIEGDASAEPEVINEKKADEEAE